MLEELDGSNLLSSRGTSFVFFLLCVFYCSSPYRFFCRKGYAVVVCTLLCILHVYTSLNIQFLLAYVYTSLKGRPGAVGEC
jgi:hypothetical protein